MKAAAVIPAYNEEGKIGKVVSKIPRARVSKIIVVDDASEDNTRDEAIKEGAHVISHTKNTGVGSAIRTGLDEAQALGYDIAVIMGGDDQDNPDQIPRLIDPIINDNYDFIQGSRYLKGGEVVNITLFRKLTTRFYSLLMKLLTSKPVTDGTNGFRAFKLSLCKHPGINLNQNWLDTYELEPYLLYKTLKLGCKFKEAPVTKRYPLNRQGFTKMKPFVDWWRILKPLILLSLHIRK